MYIAPFIGTLKAAERRDFTVNALMQNVLTGEIIDHYGGRNDLEAGVIRHVNDIKFAEDPLRVVRAAQFAARFDFVVAPETKERIMGELEKALLKVDRPSVFLEVLQQMGQLDVWFSGLKDLRGVSQRADYHPEGDAWKHIMMVLDAAADLHNKADKPLYFMLAALCHDFGKKTASKTGQDGIVHALRHEEQGLPLVRSFLGKLTTETKLTKYCLNMTALHMKPNVLAREKVKLKTAARLFDQAVSPEDLLLLAEADHKGRIAAPSYEEPREFLHRRLEEYYELMSRPYVMGRDLVEAGMQPSKQMGEAVAFAHKLRLAGVPKKQSLVQTLAEFLK